MIRISTCGSAAVVMLIWPLSACSSAKSEPNAALAELVAATY